MLYNLFEFKNKNDNQGLQFQATNLSSDIFNPFLQITDVEGTFFALDDGKLVSLKFVVRFFLFLLKY